jgi:hypothetical protein
MFSTLSEAAETFDVHGLGVTVGGDWPEVVEALRRDFAWWSSDIAVPAQVKVEIRRRAPDYAPYASLPAVAVTERNVVYAYGDERVVDYGGRALSIQSGKRLVVESQDGYTARRAAFDFVLGAIGRHVDRIGLPRVHGLGLVGAQGGVLVMIPSGGGKTTLALRAIQEPGVGLLSEGSPLLDADGRLHPFPLPLWVRTTSAEAAWLPEAHVRRLDGIEPDPLILELPAFSDRVPVEPARLSHIVLGRRSLAEESRLERLSRRAATRPLLRESVFGLGFFQGLELVARGKLPVSIGTTAVRGRRCFTALRHAQVWGLTLGRDKERNWRTLEQLLSA